MSNVFLSALPSGAHNLSEQIPCTRVTAFSRTSLGRFWREFRYLLSPTNQSAKSTDQKMIIFAFSRRYFSFLISYASNAFIDMVEIPFSREKVH